MGIRDFFRGAARTAGARAGAALIDAALDPPEGQKRRNLRDNWNKTKDWARRNLLRGGRNGMPAGQSRPPEDKPSAQSSPEKSGSQKTQNENDLKLNQTVLAVMRR